MTDNTILLVTTSYDIGTDYVVKALSARSASYFRLNTDEFPSHLRIIYDPMGDAIFNDGTSSILGSQVKAVWYRRLVAPDLPVALERGVIDFCERETNAFLTGVIASIGANSWLSSPVAIRIAEAKPYQLKVAHDIGFKIPHTIITNNSIAVKDFAMNYHLIAKAVRSGYIETDQGNRAIFTSIVDRKDLNDLDGLDLSPVIFQEFIDKVSDIRITIVGDKVFAAEIMSQTREASKIDWRATDDPRLEHRRHRLPQIVIEQCLELMHRLGLQFCAIDMALTSDGEYVFLEINPNGEWVWIEDLLGYPISASIAEWLDV